MKLYAFHGTDRTGYEGIGSGNRSKNGIVTNANFLEGKGSTTWAVKGLGKGVYVTTYYDKARKYGDYIYLVEFSLHKVKIVDEWDNDSAWRCDPTIDGAYMPTSLDGGCAQYDEFCIRVEKITRAYLVRYPDGSRVSNPHFDKPLVARAVFRNAYDEDDLPFVWRSGKTGPGAAKAQAHFTCKAIQGNNGQVCGRPAKYLSANKMYCCGYHKNTSAPKPVTIQVCNVLQGNGVLCPCPASMRHCDGTMRCGRHAKAAPVPTASSVLCNAELKTRPGHFCTNKASVLVRGVMRCGKHNK